MTKKVPASFGLGLLLAITACGSDAPALTYPAMNKVTEGAARIHRGDTVTIGSMFGCLDRKGSVTVTDIAAVNSTGLKVTGWAVRPNPFWKAPDPAAPVGGQIGVERMTLTTLRFPTGKVLDATCGKDGKGYEFAVQVLKTTSGPAGASGWLVTYISDGQTKKLAFPLAVRLCSEKVSWSRQCTALKV
jgi:hypothetical protein